MRLGALMAGHIPPFASCCCHVGADADITVFDAERIIGGATFEEPLQASAGIHFVFVNGAAVLKDGQLVDGVLPGKAARAPLS